MKLIELTYTQLIGKTLTYDTLIAIRSRGLKETGMTDADCEKRGSKDFKKIGSKQLYGSTLLVGQLMNY